MFKQFQKLGLFLSRDVTEDTKPKNDKVVQYLYKKEPEISEKAAKRKFDVTYSPKHSRKHHTTDTKYKSHHKKSKESLVRKPRKRQSLVNTKASETEIYFISPEEIKRHRKRLEKREQSLKKSREHKMKQNDRKLLEERRSQKRKDDIASFIKHQRQNRGTFDKDAYEWLTKKDIFKLLSNVPKNAESSILKKFFVFDKQDSIQEKDKCEGKINQSRENNTNTALLQFNVSADSTTKKLEKITKTNKSRQLQEDPQYLQKRHELSKTEKGHGEQKHQNLEAIYKNIKKRQSQETENRIVFEDLELYKKNKKSLPSKSQQVKEPESCKTSALKVQSLNAKGQPEMSAINKEESNRKTKNECGVNPLRHKYCLAKNTFSIVDIPPRSAHHDCLERKKKTKSFKKYYRYSRNPDVDSEISSTHHTFSDSHKLYQDLSEQSAEDTYRKNYKRTRRDITRRNLKLETNVSEVVVSPVMSYAQNKTSSQSSKGDEIATKIVRRRSKIPIMNNIAKIVELAAESPTTSRGRQKSANLFIPKVLSKESMHTGLEDKLSEKKVGKTSVSRNDRNVERRGKTDNTEVQLKQKKTSSSSTKPNEKKPTHSNEQRQSSAKFKQNKVSGSDKKSEFRTLPASRNRNISPPPFRKQSLEFESHTRDGSPVRSECSKRSNKTSVASKSDTKLKQSSRTSLQKKNKKKDSTKASMSNSTFDDRSLDSSKNGTSFLLTKTFKDDDKLSRWQKQKIYSDNLRKSVINKKQKTPVIPPQVLEVRYLTVSNDNPGLVDANLKKCLKDNDRNLTRAHQSEESEESEEFYDEDLPYPHIELVDNNKFQELIELSTDEALDEILNENNDFLKKDFSLVIRNLDESTSSQEDISSDDSLSPEDRKVDDNWYDFHIDDVANLQEISYRSSKQNFQNSVLDDQDNTVDLFSAPCSEESGYATINSKQFSRSFFKRPEIKALFEPQETLDSYSIEVHIASSNSSSNCEFVRSLHKSLQASVECLQKSVQIQVSQDIFDVNGFKENLVNVPLRYSKTSSPPALKDKNLDKILKENYKPRSYNKFTFLLRSIRILRKKISTKVQKVCGKTKKKLRFLSRVRSSFNE